MIEDATELGFDAFGMPSSDFDASRVRGLTTSTTATAYGVRQVDARGMSHGCAFNIFSREKLQLQWYSDGVLHGPQVIITSAGAVLITHFYRAEAIDEDSVEYDSSNDY